MRSQHRLQSVYDPDADAAELDIDVLEGSWSLDRVGQASEVMALSTIREVQAVSAIGDVSFDEGSVTKRLFAAFEDLVS